MGLAGKRVHGALCQEREHCGDLDDSPWEEYLKLAPTGPKTL